MALFPSVSVWWQNCSRRSPTPFCASWEPTAYKMRSTTWSTTSSWCHQRARLAWKLCTQLSLRLCERLGVPIADHKVDGSSTVLTYLGIELDSAAPHI